MKTTTRTTTSVSRAQQARQRELQAILQARQIEMQSVLQRRVRPAPFDRRDHKLDETEQCEADVQDSLEAALIQMKRDTLERIWAALIRLDAGEYGYCVECESEISEKRLRALPFAVRCTACEESHEEHVAREHRLASPHGFQVTRADQAGF